MQSQPHRIEARFRDRADAGRRLAEALAAYGGQSNIRVLALPRGGVPVAYEVARGLQLPLDVFVVRKLGVPGHEELAMGAIAGHGVRVLNADIVRMLALDSSEIDRVVARESKELERRNRAYRGEQPPLDVEGCTVIVVDDGLATGASMRAAVAALRQLAPERIVVAVPVGAPDTCRSLAREADEVICLSQPEHFHAVGLWYQDFDQTTDDEVRALLAGAGAWAPGHTAAACRDGPTRTAR